MTFRISADHKAEGVFHQWFPDGKFGTLSFGSDGLGNRVFLDSPADIDAVIAELAALRAEMTGEADDEYRLTPKGEAVADAATGTGAAA